MELLKTSLGSLTLATALLAGGSALAIVPESGTRPLPSIVGVTSPNVTVTFEGGTAIVSGSVDSSGEVQLIVSHLANLEGVDKVVNLITAR
jgi:hypothetical protein